MGTKADTAAQSSSRHGEWKVIVFLFACNLLASFMQSIMNIALDQVSTDFHVRLAEANLVIIVFAIVAGTVITTAASVIRRFGLRKVMLFGLGMLLSVNSGVIGIGLAFAPPIAGLLITYAGLRALFLVPTVLSALLLVAGFFVIHDITSREDRPIDAMSIVLSFVGLGAFMVGLNEISHHGMAAAGVMLAGLAVIALFVWRQTRIEHPLLDMRSFKTAAFTAGEVLIVLAYMGSVYLSLRVPLYLEGAAGFSAFVAGCILAVPILCYALTCFASGKMLGKHGVWPLVPAGLGVVLVGFAVMLATMSLSSALLVAACTALVYAGIGAVYPAIKSVDLEVLPQELSSDGSAIHSTLVQVAGCISSALYVGMMSGIVESQMAGGATKTQAYAFGFAHTLPIEIGLIVAAIAVSLAYVRLVRKFAATHHAKG